MGQKLELYINIYGEAVDLETFTAECQKYVVPVTGAVVDYQLNWPGRASMGLDRFKNSENWYQWAGWVEVLDEPESDEWKPFDWAESLPPPGGRYIQLRGLANELASLVDLLEFLTTRFPTWIELYTRRGLDECLQIEFFAGQSVLAHHYTDPPEAGDDESEITWFIRDGVEVKTGVWDANNEVASPLGKVGV